MCNREGREYSFNRLNSGNQKIDRQTDPIDWRVHPVVSVAVAVTVVEVIYGRRRVWGFI